MNQEIVYQLRDHALLAQAAYRLLETALRYMEGGPNYDRCTRAAVSIDSLSHDLHKLADQLQEDLDTEADCSAPSDDFVPLEPDDMLFTLEDFFEWEFAMLESDGSAFYATADKWAPLRYVKRKGRHPKWATHVVWFNK